MVDRNKEEEKVWQILEMMGGARLLRMRFASLVVWVKVMRIKVCFIYGQCGRSRLWGSA